MRARREARQEHREEKRDDRRGNHTGLKVAAGVAAVGVGAAVIHNRRKDKGGDDDSDDDDHGPKTYAMREKLLTFGDDFVIEKMSRRGARHGKKEFYCDNKVLRLRETFNLREFHGSRKTLYQIQDRKMRLRDSMAIEDGDGRKVAEIKKKVIGVVRDNFVVKVRDDKNWQIHGSILEHNFTIKEDHREIVKVHKKWIAPIKDCYFIDIDHSDDVALALMVVIGLEHMTSDN